MHPRTIGQKTRFWSGWLTRNGSLAFVVFVVGASVFEFFRR